MRKFISILLVLCCVVCLSVAALADDYGDNISTFDVTFTASKTMNKSYTQNQLKAAIADMQPGDSVTLNFNLQNKSDVTTTWYINNSVTDSLERTKEATNGAYTYVLTAVDSDGKSQTLYDSKTVNGEGTGNSGDGLNSATKTLDDWKGLYDLAAGASGQVTLEIALDGESQANQYQDTDASVELSFAAEVSSTNSSASSPSNNNNSSGTGTGTGNSSGSSSTGSSSAGTGTSVVRTGDRANMPVMVIVAGVSGLLLLGLAIWSVKARKHEKEDSAK